MWGFFLSIGVLNQQMDTFLLLCVSSATSNSKRMTQVLLHVNRDQQKKKKKAFATFKKLHFYLAYLSRFLNWIRDQGKCVFTLLFLTVLYFSFQCQRKIAELERRGIFWPFGVLTSK